jgi:hypothetical protein
VQADVNPHDYRRRFVPGYDVFQRKMPKKSITPLKFILVDGVFNVIVETLHPDEHNVCYAANHTANNAANNDANNTMALAVPNGATADGALPYGAMSPAVTFKSYKDATDRPVQPSDNLYPVLSFAEFLKDFVYVGTNTRKKRNYLCDKCPYIYRCERPSFPVL